MSLKNELEEEILLAEMMSIDIDKIYKKYAKSALEAEQKRVEKIKTEKYNGCSTFEELQNLYAYGEITLYEFDAGRDFLKLRDERMEQLSLVEKHRKNLKELRDKWKGTVKELQEELNEINGVIKDKRTYVEKLEAEERSERYSLLN